MLKTTFQKLARQTFISTFRQAPRISPFLSKATFSTTEEANKADKAQPEKPKDPKWMRFFKGMDPSVVDLERAAKSDNPDLLHNYVKMNFLSFEFSHLVIALGSLVNIGPTNGKLLVELKIRLALRKQESSKKNTLILFSKAKNLVVKDDIMSKYVLLEIDKYFEEYTHAEQTEALNFMFEANTIKTDKLRHYISFYDELIKQDKVDEHFKNLTSVGLLSEIILFQHLHRNLETQEFYKLVDQKLLDSAANQLLTILADPIQMQERVYHYDFEPALPPGTPSFFTPEQEQKFKSYLAQNNIYTRYNLEENLGIYLHKRRERNIMKLLRENFGVADRYFLEKPFFAALTYLRYKINLNERFELFTMPLMAKFGILDLTYLEGALEMMKGNLKSSLRKGYVDRSSMSFVLTRWRELTNLNFEDALKSVDHSEKQIVTFVKAEMVRLFEKVLADSTGVNDMFATLIEVLTTLKPQQIDPKDKLLGIKEGFGELEDYKDAKLEGESMLEALREAIHDEKEDIDGANEDLESQVDDAQTREARRQKSLLEMVPKLHEEYDEALRSAKFARLNYFDRLLQQYEIDALSDYFGIVDNITRFLLFNTVTDTFIVEVKKFFARREHETMFGHFTNFPGFLDNLVLIDMLYKDHNEKLGGEGESCLPDALRIRVHQQKRKMDNFYAHYNGKPATMLSDIEGKLLQKAETTNELNMRSSVEAEKLLMRALGIEIQINHNKEKYQQEIEISKIQESDMKYKFSNCKDISKIYGSSEESFYIRCLNTPVFSRVTNNSYLKEIVARTLTKMGITYQQDYCDFPLIADFLIMTKDHSKVIIQIVDPQKLILGVENVFGYYAKMCDYGFTRHGYKIINFRFQDYDVDENAIMERLKAAISSSA